MLGQPSPACPVRLCGITGYDGRINDVVYCHPELRADHNTTVVFFGGDIQDFTENMQNHRENKNYLKWNLEDTAVAIHAGFPDCHVLAIRPAKLSTPNLATFMDYVTSGLDPNRIEYKTFSCFENFVPCNNCGVPEHTPMHYALQHLERILQGVSLRIRNMPTSELSAATSRIIQQEAESAKAAQVTDENVATITSPDSPTDINSGAANEENDRQTQQQNLVQQQKDDETFWWRENLNLDKNELILVGFSKGCVVLNQFIYEFHYLKTLTPDDESMMRIVSKIRDMYWLDGGHSGGKNTWITSRSLLETLTRLGIRVHIHVTPYQIQDDRRPWIRKEEKAFGDLLRRLGAPVQRTVHFENVFPSLCLHFDVLTAFRQQIQTNTDQQK